MCHVTQITKHTPQDLNTTPAKLVAMRNVGCKITREKLSEMRAHAFGLGDTVEIKRLCKVERFVFGYQKVGKKPDPEIDAE